MNKKLIEDIEALGLRSGDNVLIHSAFSSLKHGATPAEFIDAVRSVIGDGTLLLPTLSWANVTRENPVFNVGATETCTGYLTQYFWTSYPGAVRSVHPTHSCAAVGKDAMWFVGEHELDSTPVGEHSPFRRLRDAGGKLLFLGCGTEPNTSMHGVEELAEPDYLYGPELEYTLTDRNGRTYTKVYRTHGFENTDQRYERLETLLPPDKISRGKILSADCVLMDAKAVWATALEKMRSEKHFFVDING